MHSLSNSGSFVGTRKEHQKMSPGENFEEYSIECDSKNNFKYKNFITGYIIEFKCSYRLPPVEIDLWEEKIFWNNDSKGARTLCSSRNTGDIIAKSFDLDSYCWEDLICMDKCFDHSEENLPMTSKVYSGDDILLDLEKHKVRPKLTHSFEKFNISQDSLYERARKVTLDRTRQSYGYLPLKHSLPALKLYPQYFKPQLTKKELRNFHRPSIRIMLNTPISFSPLKPRNLKYSNKNDMAELYKSPRQLSLRDSTDFILLEYSEEFPVVLSNVGMSSFLYNYYRKKFSKDRYVPEFDTGVPFVLESVDTSPFMGFGDVFPGQSLQAISNNMYKAPVFSQSVNPRDLLMIQYTLRGKTRYYLRDIPYIFTVGQILPLKEVPPPQSRRITQTVKGRMQVVAFRLMKKDPENLLLYDKFFRIFHGWSELHLKQRLKEFSQFAKKGDNTGWWKLKQGVKLPSEEEIREIVTPEMVCLCQSMLVGQQWFKDLGYIDAEELDDDNSGDLELMLAPWNITKNFVQASQNKSMVRVYGDGDPTGRGEAFSFLRASMKEPFLRAGEKENDKYGTSKVKMKSYHRFSFAEQQQIYREEIIRIWNAQLAALSSRDMVPDDHLPDDNNVHKNENEEFPQFESSDEAQTILGYVKKLGMDRQKILKVRRIYSEPDGTKRSTKEVIKNPNLINAYLKRRAVIEKKEEALKEASKKLSPEEFQKKRKEILQEYIGQIRERQSIRGQRKRKMCSRSLGIEGKNRDAPIDSTVRLKIRRDFTKALGDSTAPSV